MFRTLPSSSVTMDTNKFLMSQNTFNENYAGRAMPITDIKSMSKVYIDGDTYTNNGGTYREALTKYGSISSGVNVNGSYSIFSLEQFFSTSASVTTVMSEAGGESSLQNYYPIGPLSIDSVFYISIANVNFDNNAFPEIKSSLQTFTYSSPGILILRCSGELHMSSVTFQNYKGIGVTEANTVTGTTK